MRTQQQINDIKQTFSKAFTFQNAISHDKINFLIEHFDNSEDKIHKNTGPVVLNVFEGDGIIDDVLSFLKSQIGDFDLRFAHYFQTNNPHIIHNDDDFDYPQIYKAFVIPLRFSPDNTSTELVVFNQSYFDGPSKFMKDEDTSKFPVYYNTFVTDYSNVHDLDDKGIDESIQKKLTHLRPTWLEGLSVESIVNQSIGDIIMFDSAKLHCATDFRQLQITSKLALSIFTKIK